MNPSSRPHAPQPATSRRRPPVFSLGLVGLCLLTVAVITGASPGPASAQEIPTFASVAGHDFGERITTHPEMVAYLRALEAASPRVTVVDQGTSWEGRALLVAIVTSPENHQRLDAIRAGAQQLGDPRGLSTEQRDTLFDEQPAIVWLGGSIHGFELSGSEGLLKLLEHLTTRDDAATQKILDETVVLIDPVLNPDGRDAFAHFNHQRLGIEPNARRDDWANQVDPWDALAFRTGHYFFDTNRDWFAHSQRETQARVPTLVEWRPQVIVDAHEMGPDLEFYFDPPNEPFAPYFPQFAKTWFDTFGSAYADAFDAAGFEYTQRDIFNYFFPGYTTSYGSYQGAVGMLYEQGSSRGLALERSDGSVRTLGQALEQQYTASLAAVTLSANERRKLLSEYHAARVAAVDEGRSGTRRYFLSSEGDPTRAVELAQMLQRNGIEVQVLQTATEVSDLRDRRGRAIPARTLPAGTWVVDAAQPQSPLIRTLLEPDLEVPAAFLEEARARLDRGENPAFYDITGWSLPLLFDLPAYSSRATPDLDLAPLDGPAPVAVTQADEDALYAYLVDGRSAASMAVLHGVLAEGHRASVMLKPTRVAGEDVASGTVVVRSADQGPALGALLRKLCQEHRVGLRTVTTGRGDAGLPALGSTDVQMARASHVALLAEGGVHAYSFGWAWYTLGELYGIRPTVLRASSLGNAPLDDFDSLVIPDLFAANALADTLGEAGLERLGRWVREGGTLVALGQAVDFARDSLGFDSLRSWRQVHGGGEDDEGKAKKEQDGPPPRPITIPGALVDTELDLESWLAAGYGGDALPFLMTSNRLYLAPDDQPSPARQIVARVPETLTASGHLWEENRERLPGSVLVYAESVGQGGVVFFAEDPNYRAHFRGAHRLLLNAILLGPTAF